LDKPILFAAGKGNGSMTISNTKGSGPKGPIKSLIKELSKYAVVVLTPEDNTSRLCNICKEDVSHVEVFKTKSKKEICKMNEMEAKLYDQKIEIVNKDKVSLKNIEKEEEQIKCKMEANVKIEKDISKMLPKINTKIKNL